MSKKISTIKGYLEDRIEDLQADIRTYTNKRDWIAEANTTAKLWEVERILKVYNQQCEEILEAVGITQEKINEQLLVDIKKTIVQNKYRAPLGKDDIAIYLTDMPLAAEKIYELVAGYTARECIKFAEWVSKEGYEFSESLGDIWVKLGTHIGITSGGLYQQYEITKENRQSSTEEGTGSNQ